MPTPQEQQLQEILTILRAMNTRDRLRTWGGFARGCIAIIPIILVVWSAWYMVEHGQELLTSIANTAASSAAAATRDQGKGMVDDLLKKYSLPAGTR